MAEELRARVFISCGQKDPEEVAGARSVSETLDRLGFDPILVTGQSTFSGVLENVFDQLQAAEYYVMLDFWRGGGVSVFSHQELAVAAFLDREWALFRDDRLGAERPGLMGFVPSHIEPFHGPGEVAQVVERVVSRKLANREWGTTWRRQLILTIPDPLPGDAYTPFAPGTVIDIPPFRTSVTHLLTRYFQATVRNLDHSRVAHSCVAYVDRLVDLAESGARPVLLAPLKWGGITSMTTEIPPGGAWNLDLFHAYRNTAKGTVAFNQFLVDWTGFEQQYTLQGGHEYQLDVVVYSDTFPPARGGFRIRFGLDSNDIEVTPVSPAAASPTAR